MIIISRKIIDRAVLALFLVVSMSACDKITDTTSGSGGGGDSAKVAEAPADTEEFASADTEELQAAVAAYVEKSDAEQTAASEPEPESSSSIDPEPAEASGDTEELAAAVAAYVDKSDAENSKQELMECVEGHYNFVTDKDGKQHFSGIFYANGTIQYWLQDGPKGTWNMDRGDDIISYRGPFGINFGPHTFHWKIKDRRSDCKIQSFVGKSFGGNDMTASRR